MLEAIAEFFVGKVADEIFALAKEQMGKLFQEQGDILLERFDRFEDRLDLQLLAPLRAGLTFLKLGRLEQAIDQLVIAEATDPLASTPKLWLAVALATRGDLASSRKFLETALQLNPFVGTGFASFYSAEFAVEDGESSENLQSSPLWSAELLDEQVKQTLPKQPLLKEVSEFAARASSAITVVATGAGEPVVGWICGGRLDLEPEEFISVFDSSFGSCKWTRKASKSNLYFATPRYIVMESREKLPRYTLLNLKDGEVVRVMSSEYFSIAFQPPYIHRSNVSALNFMTWKMLDTERAYNQTKRPKPRRWYSPLRPFFQVPHDYSHLFEKKSLPLPTDSGLGVVDVENDWSHAHIIVPHVFGTMPMCGLWGKARLQRIV